MALLATAKYPPLVCVAACQGVGSCGAKMRAICALQYSAATQVSPPVGAPVAGGEHGRKLRGGALLSGDRHGRDHDDARDGDAW